MKDILISITLLTLWALAGLAGIRLSSLERKTKQLENFIENTCKIIREEIDENGKEE